MDKLPSLIIRAATATAKRRFPKVPAAEWIPLLETAEIMAIRFAGIIETRRPTLPKSATMLKLIREAGKHLASEVATTLARK